MINKGFDGSRMYNNIVGDESNFVSEVVFDESLTLRKKITELLNKKDNNTQINNTDIDSFTAVINGFKEKILQFFASEETCSPNLKTQTKSCQNLQLDLRYLVYLYFSENFFDTKADNGNTVPDLSKPKFPGLNNAILELFSNAGKILDVLDESVKMTPNVEDNTAKLEFYKEQIESFLNKKELAERLFYCSTKHDFTSISNSLLKEASEDNVLIEKCIFKKKFSKNFFEKPENKSIIDDNQDVAVNILKSYKSNNKSYDQTEDINGFWDFVSQNIDNYEISSFDKSKKGTNFTTSVDNLKKKQKGQPLLDFLQNFFGVEKFNSKSVIANFLKSTASSIQSNFATKLADTGINKNNLFTVDEGSKEECFYEQYKLIALILLHYTDAYDFYKEIKGQLKVMLLPEEIDILNDIAKSIIKINNKKAIAGFLKQDITMNQELKSKISRIKQRQCFTNWTTAVTNNSETQFFKQCSCEGNELKNITTNRALIDYIFYRAFIQPKIAECHYCMNKHDRLQAKIKGQPNEEEEKKDDEEIHQPPSPPPPQPPQPEEEEKKGGEEIRQPPPPPQPPQPPQPEGESENFKDTLKTISDIINELDKTIDDLKSNIDQLIGEIDDYLIKKPKEQRFLSPYMENDMLALKQYRDSHECPEEQRTRIDSDIKKYSDVRKFIKNGDICSLNYHDMLKPITQGNVHNYL